MTKHRLAAMGAAFLMAAFMTTGCKKDSGSSDKESSEKKPAVMDSGDRIAEAYKDVEDLESGPELSVSRTSAPAGAKQFLFTMQTASCSVRKALSITQRKTFVVNTHPWIISSVSGLRKKRKRKSEKCSWSVALTLN